MNKNKIIAIICLVLIVSTPLAYSQYFAPGAAPLTPTRYASSNPSGFLGPEYGGSVYNNPFADNYRRYSGGYSYGQPIYLGESIIVNIADYEPKQVRESLLDQSNVPVFFYLKGTTFGTMLSPFTKDPEARDPLSGITNIPVIEYIDVILNDTEASKYILGRPVYIPPRRDRYSLSNLGALVVYLKRLEGGAELPKDSTIKLDMAATIFFNLEESNMFGLSRQDLTLKAYPNEEEFSSRKGDYQIFSGKGYVRAISIDDSGALLQVYNREMLPVAFAKQYATAMERGGLQTRSTFRLTKGGQSQILSFGYTGNPLLDTFQVRLEDVASPKDRAEFEFTVNGRSSTRKVNVGGHLTAGSDWILTDIEEKGRKGITRDDIIKLSRDYKLSADSQATLANLLQSTEIFDTNYVATIENAQGEIKIITRRALVTKDGNIPNFVKSPDENTAKAIEREYCPYDTAEKPYYKVKSESGQVDYACEAIARYRTIVDRYPNSEEAKLATKDLAEIYEKLLINYPACELTSNKNQPKNSEECLNFQIDMFRLADFYYNKIGIKDRLKDKLGGIGGQDYLEDIGASIQLKKVEKISVKEQGTATVRVYSKEDPNTFFDVNLNIGDMLPITESDYRRLTHPDETISEINKIKEDKSKKTLPFDTLVKYKNGKRLYFWRVADIKPASVVLKLVEVQADKDDLSLLSKIMSWVKNKVGLIAGETTGETITLPIKQISPLPTVYEQINENTGSLVESGQQINVEVRNIASAREAYITVIPGSTRAFTTSQFSVNIPVDPRPFKWTPEQLQSHINATTMLLKKIDTVINKMDSLVKRWKKVCLGTFAFLTLKSSLLQGSVRAQARKMSSGWIKERCKYEVLQKGVSGRPDFDTEDQCYAHYSDEIKKATDTTEKAYNEANEKLKGTIDKIDGGLTDTSGKCRKFGDYRDAAQQLGLSNTAIVKNYRDCYAYSSVLDQYNENDAYAQYTNNQLSAVSVDINSFVTDRKLALDQAKSLSGYDKLPPEKQNEVVRSMVDSIREGREKAQEKDDRVKNLVVIGPEEDKTRKTVITKAVAALKVGVDDKGVEQIGPVELIGVNQYAYQLAQQDNYDHLNIGVAEKNLKEKICKKHGNYDATKNTCTIEGGPAINVINPEIESMKKNIAVDDKGQQVYISNDFFDKGAGLIKTSIANSNLKECTAKQGIFEDSECKVNFLRSTVQLDQAGRAISSSYSSEEAIFDADGLVLCYPVGKGNYVKVLDRYPTGSRGIKTIQLWNVGSNERIECGQGDDQLIKHESEFDLLTENLKQKTDLIRKGETLGKCNKDGDLIGKNLRCRKFSADQFSSLVKPKCIDVMEPEDCKLLFNACDPVMCPSSRCTLGGRVPPRNVIQSGIIGSTVLCLPNIREGIIVPVCLTGIDAGLKNIKSLLESYKDCLEIKLNKGEDVGFCDYIRSVGVCEMMWREAAGLLDISGSFIDWASGKMFGDPEGGGEYLKFQSNFQNIGDSVRVFTNEYKDTYTAQFLGQSSEEIGTQICRLSVNGKIPNLPAILDQLTEPENPPQFTAFFDEAPYAAPGEIAGMAGPSVPYGTTELSLYKVFYHIYAGTGYYQGVYSQPQSLFGGELPSGIQQPIVYSVYLINRELGLQPLYVTYREDESIGGFQASIKPGSYAQKSVQKVGPRGYKQICVNINGQESCGFGKISSSFGIRELADSITKSDATKKGINSSLECTSDVGSSSTASALRLGALGGAGVAGGMGLTGTAGTSGFGASAFGTITQGTSPAIGLVTSGLDRSLLSNGIVRVCAITAPTQEPGRWGNVGSCGTDNLGRSLGVCWLDKTSINMEDAELKKETMLDLLKGRGDLDVSKFIDPETSKAGLVTLEGRKKEIMDTINDLVLRAKKNFVKTETVVAESGMGGKESEKIIGTLTLSKPRDYNSFNIRREADIKSDLVGSIPASKDGTINVDVLSTKKDNAGKTWYLVRYNDIKGYVREGPSIKYSGAEQQNE